MLIASISILLAGALVSASAARRPKMAAAISMLSLIMGCLSGLAAVVGSAAWGGSSKIAAGWPLPWARLSMSLDGLSTFFLLTVLIVSLLSGIYGEAYIRRSEGLSKSKSARPLFLTLTASLVAVVCAQNAILFLFAWELMALASFFLVIAEDEHPEVRRAGYLYFICTHTATLALLILFAILGRAAGTLDFGGIRSVMPPSAGSSTLLLLLALIGFGMKAGITPFHIWLQEAHPAAPSHVSAVMSGIVIKIGIYGFLRLIWILRSVPDIWAVVLVLAGAVSGVGGVLSALAQHDLKRLLAYHSVENIGIITLGLGLGCLGLSHHKPELALLGFAGAILHTLNHALFKSLLFLGSGSFYQALGTREIEAGGGLLKLMPWTSALSLIGAAAISGIPPFNGFVSEWLVYMASSSAMRAGEARLAAVSIGGLALIGGLAVACFTKAYGALCLGIPRTEAAKIAKDPGPAMTVPMAALAALCVFIGCWPGPALSLAQQAAAAVCGMPPDAARPALAGFLNDARLIGLAGAGVIVIGALLAFARSLLLGGRVTMGPTWACGFTAPTARMQYTASSYSQPLTRAFAPVLGIRARFHAPAGYWPTESRFSSHADDLVLDRLLIPAGSATAGLLAWLKRRQRSRLQYSMLAVALFLLALLAWKL
jgi:hydrogenase-4 component B